MDEVIWDLFALRQLVSQGENYEFKSILLDLRILPVVMGWVNAF